MQNPGCEKCMKVGTTDYGREFELPIFFSSHKQNYDWLMSGALTTHCVKIHVTSRNVYLAFENTMLSETKCWNYAL